MIQKRLIPGLVAVLILMVCMTPGAAFAQEVGGEVRITQVDTENFPEVVVYVSVADRSGETIGVESDQLALTENGKRIIPESVEGMGAASPITTLMLIDISGSMKVDNKLAAAKSAALEYVDGSRPVDRIGLIAFNTQVSIVQEITQDKDAVRLGIESLEGIYDTALLDALLQGVELLRMESGRKAMILMTDGLDNQSQTSLEELLQELALQDFSVSTIGFGNREHDQTALSALDEDMLQAIAKAGGGLYSYAEDQEALEEVYAQYGKLLQSEYVIRYISPSALRDGLNRSIVVELVQGAEVTGGVAEEGAAEQVAVYNPGGLVPESAVMASRAMFLQLLAPLVVLLLLPGMAGFFRRVFAGGRKNADPGRGGKGRIRLK
jgi:Ca-activated chloride channel homolog